jgi:TM2 domain-containing membrane protein YozV
MTHPAAQTMLYDANKKSTGVAYLLWLFLGCLGGHRFYAGKTGSAVAQLLLSLAGWLLIFIGIGLLPLIVVGVWVLIDAFLIPGWVRNTNTKLATALSAGDTAPSI